MTGGYRLSLFPPPHSSCQFTSALHAQTSQLHAGTFGSRPWTSLSSGWSMHLEGSAHGWRWLAWCRPPPRCYRACTCVTSSFRMTQSRGIRYQVARLDSVIIAEAGGEAARWCSCKGRFYAAEHSPPHLWKHLQTNRPTEERPVIFATLLLTFRPFWTILFGDTSLGSMDLSSLSPIVRNYWDALRRKQLPIVWLKKALFCFYEKTTGPYCDLSSGVSLLHATYDPKSLPSASPLL